MSEVTIRVNPRTKAGKNLLETARMMAEKYKGIDFDEDDSDLLKKMVRNSKGDLLTAGEKKRFLAGVKSDAKG